MVKSLNVYDFDKTIYAGDSSIDFWKFCVRKHKRCTLLVPKILYNFALYSLGHRSKTEFKEVFFSFLRYIPDVDHSIVTFWEQNRGKINPWFLNLERKEGLVISASPEFLLLSICEELHLKLIGSKINKKTETFSGLNCRGEEKVRRFQKEYPEYNIYEFYSDSLTDKSLAELAEKSYLVSGNNLTPWKFT